MKKFDIDKAITTLEKKVQDFQVPVVDLIQAQTKEAWKVLVATLLSARTKDEVTAVVARKLFKKLSDIQQFADLSEEEIQKLIHPVGFYRNKARFLKKLPTVLNELYAGIIPDTVEELVKLPGVGRKTANLVVAVAFNKPAICVDTHVHRIMNIWGYVDTPDPLKTEMALRNKLPQKYWLIVNRVLVAYGQSICRPVSPLCHECCIQDICPQKGVTPRKIKSEVKRRAVKEGVKLISWNVNGIRACEKKGFVEFLKEASADVIGIQETKAQPDQLSDDLKNIDGYHSYWFSAEKKGYSGVAAYSKKKPLNIINGLGIEEFDFEGRVITLEFEDFYFINCYYPNAQSALARIDYKVRFNDAIRQHCDDLKSKKTFVLCGDYNVAHKAIDLKNPKPNEKNPGYSIQERDSMDKFIEAGYVDTFRMFNQEPEQYSWWSYRFSARTKNIGWRIDYFCVDEASKERVQDAGILPDILGSDHCPVTLWLK